MQIVTYDINYRNPFSILTAIVTGCSISHASIVQGNTNFDTTMSRGYFGVAERVKLFPEQMVTVYDLPEHDASEIIAELMGTPYDVLGLILWPLNIHNKKKYYCFEAALRALQHVGFDIRVGDNRVSGRTLSKYLTDKGYIGRRTQAKYILPN